MPRSTVPEQRI